MRGRSSIGRAPRLQRGGCQFDPGRLHFKSSQAVSSRSMREDSGGKLYARAKELIPGGTQLLSKRPEMFLPDLWPTYYSRAKGCEVWDLDGKRYIDMTSSGIGACLLGFADDDVNAAVKRQ